MIIEFNIPVKIRFESRYAKEAKLLRLLTENKLMEKEFVDRLDLIIKDAAKVSIEEFAKKI